MSMVLNPLKPVDELEEQASNPYVTPTDMQEYTKLGEELQSITPKGVLKTDADFTPVVGDAIAAKEVYDELQKDDPNYLLAGALGGAAIIGLIPGIGDAAANAIKAGARKIGTPKISNIDYQKKMAGFDKVDNADDWQKNVRKYVEESRDVNPTIRTPELENSAKDLLDGKITREQHLDNIDKYKPVDPWDALPREPSSKATVFSLKPDQREKGKFILPEEATKNLGVSTSSLKIGDKFNGRLDIPAYNRFDTWIVAGTSTAEKGVTHYAKAIHYKGVGDKPVRFAASQEISKRIGTGVEGKTGYATVSGEIKNLNVEEIRDQATKFLNDPEWTQVGFDPRRQGGFYVRNEKNKHVPVREADEVIQIGPLVLAKNAKLDLQHKGFNKGGIIPMQEQMKMAFMQEGGLKDDGATQDAVSGNEVPSGSMDQEVRDDVPAMLSEGEYVVPADVVRFHGVKLFEDLRMEAKIGLAKMESDGRIGGEPMEVPQGEQEQALPFDVSELVVVEEKAEGGIVGFSNGGDSQPTFTYTPNTKYGSTGSANTGFETRPYVNTADGRVVVMAFYNGQPMQVIPEGFVPQAEFEAQQKAGTAATTTSTADMTDTGGLSPYTTTEDKNIGQPETADEFFAAGDSNLSPLSKFIGLSPIVGALSDLSHSTGVERARELLERDDITEYDRLALSYYANSNPKEQGGFFNFFGLGEDSDPKYPEGFEFLTFGDGKKLTYVDSAGKKHQGTIQELKEKFAPFAKKQVVDVLPTQAKGANQIEQNNQKTLFEKTGSALTNYGNIKFMKNDTGVSSMDLFRIDDGTGQNVQFIRRYEMEKALGKKNLTADDVLKFDPSKFETVDAKDSPIDKLFKVDRTEVVPTAEVLEKTKPKPFTGGVDIADAVEQQQKLAKKEVTKKGVEAKLEQFKKGFGGLNTGGLVTRRVKKKKKKS